MSERNLLMQELRRIDISLKELLNDVAIEMVGDSYTHVHWVVKDHLVAAAHLLAVGSESCAQAVEKLKRLLEDKTPVNYFEGITPIRTLVNRALAIATEYRLTGRIDYDAD